MKTTLFMIASVDGKITTSAGSNPDYDWPNVNPHYLKIYYEQMLSMDIEGVVMSAHSFVNFMNLNKRLPKEWDRQVGVSIFVVDSRGLLNRKGVGNLLFRYKRVVIFVSKQTPTNYIRLLENLGVEFYQTPGEKVDYKKMFRQLEKLKYKKISVESGGTLNSYLLRASLIDEVHIVIVPILVGGLETPSIMDGDQLKDWRGIIPMELMGIDKLEHGFLKTKYRIVHK